MSDSYLTNRLGFLHTARMFKAEVKSYELVGRIGLDSEILATDVATLGSRQASNVVVVSTGIHGVELPFGSKTQRQWMRAAAEVCAAHKDIRFVFAHALNPYGASYGLRSDQNNVDLNRNFVDFSQPQPASANYRALADAFAPPRLGAGTMTKAWSQMLKFGLVTHSIGEFKQALAGGQYEFPDGLYYGGKEPSWTQGRWKELVRNHVTHDGLKNLWHIDIHTGDGPRGKLQLMVNTTENSPLHERVRRLGAPENIRITNTSFAKLSGDITDFWPALGLKKDVVVTPVTIEVGTSKAPSVIEEVDVLHTMIARNIAKQRYDDRHPSTPSIVAAMRDTFNPPEAGWQNGASRQARGFWKKLVAAATPAG